MLISPPPPTPEWQSLNNKNWSIPCRLQYIPISFRHPLVYCMSLSGHYPPVSWAVSSLDCYYPSFQTGLIRMRIADRYTWYIYTTMAKYDTFVPPGLCEFWPSKIWVADGSSRSGTTEARQARFVPSSCKCQRGSMIPLKCLPSGAPRLLEEIRSWQPPRTIYI